MTDISNWTYYKNLEGNEWVRANLVYTPYVSPDNKTLCMSFNRDPQYHTHDYENVNWTEELLSERFNRELDFHSQASSTMPTLKLLDVDSQNRKIFLEWHGDDFYMQGIKQGGYDNVLADWKEQWIELIQKMWASGIYKISLHPNSWTAHNGKLIPFNWFFCYNKDEPGVTVRSLLIQISSGRQEKISGIDLDQVFVPSQLQDIAFNSFKSNYPSDLIERIQCLK